MAASALLGFTAQSILQSLSQPEDSSHAAKSIVEAVPEDMMDAGIAAADRSPMLAAIEAMSALEHHVPKSQMDECSQSASSPEDREAAALARSQRLQQYSCPTPEEIWAAAWQSLEAKPVLDRRPKRSPSLSLKQRLFGHSQPHGRSSAKARWEELTVCTSREYADMACMADMAAISLEASSHIAGWRAPVRSLPPSAF
jgi:hypothetical protein